MKKIVIIIIAMLVLIGCGVFVYDHYFKRDSIHHFPSAS